MSMVVQGAEIHYIGKNREHIDGYVCFGTPIIIAFPFRYSYGFMFVMEYVCTVWPGILAGNLFWWIGGFLSNSPIKFLKL